VNTKAAVLRNMNCKFPYAQSRPLIIEEIELLPPGPDEVLLKIKAAGICHSDLSIIEGVRPRPLPMVIGHEASGEIVEVGSNVKNFAIGDHVVCSFVPSCGECLPCSIGKPSLCEPGAISGAKGTLFSGAQKIKKDTEFFFHHSGISAFSEYAVVSKHSLVKIKQDIPYEYSALFGCAVLTGVGAALNSSSLKMGSTVAIIGMGGVGMSALLGCIAAGAKEIIAIDVNDKKLEFCKELGADLCINSNDPEADHKIKELTHGGVDIVLEFAGHPSAIEFAWKITKRGGEIVSASLAKPNATFQLPLTNLVTDEKKISGCYMGSSVPRRDIPNYIDLFLKGKLPVDRLITHKLKLEEINESMDRLKSGEAIRQIIMF